MNEHFASGLTNISTHTLTWSVTNPKGEYWNYFYISTHTLTWSVTFRIVINVADDKNFNSHAHVERDLSRAYHRWISSISTHTLTWSVTEAGKKFTLKLGISTHTLTWSVTKPRMPF